MKNQAQQSIVLGKVEHVAGVIVNFREEAWSEADLKESCRVSSWAGTVAQGLSSEVAPNHTHTHYTCLDIFTLKFVFCK